MKLTPEQRQALVDAVEHFINIGALNNANALDAMLNRLTAAPAPVPDEVVEIERKLEACKRNTLGLSYDTVLHYACTLLRIIKASARPVVTISDVTDAFHPDYPNQPPWKKGERWRFVDNTKVYRSYADYVDD